jgi:hypothetical protein
MLIYIRTVHNFFPRSATFLLATLSDVIIETLLKDCILGCPLSFEACFEAVCNQMSAFLYILEGKVFGAPRLESEYSFVYRYVRTLKEMVARNSGKLSSFYATSISLK